MGLKHFDVRSISLLILLACIVQLAHGNDFCISKFGGKPNTDITKALKDAWKGACKSRTPSKIIIPKGTYPLGEVYFEGPCKAPITFQIEGTLKAGKDVNKMKCDGWITFYKVNNLTMSGGGTFDGEGEEAWKKNNCNKNCDFHKLPMNLRLNYVNNSLIEDLTSANSKNFHVNLMGCYNLTIQRFTISAPKESINTDGIHMGRSVGITIRDTHIATGDDCISIGDGTENLLVEKVTCGPGHGISVGSLGKYKDEKDVKGIVIRNCTLTNTENGVRVKTWPSAPSATTASDLVFEDIIMNKVTYPILVDQEYCPWNKCNKGEASKVKINNVSFKKIRGTSSNQMAVKILCSSLHPCNVHLEDIELKFTGKGRARSECAHVTKMVKGRVVPRVCAEKAMAI